MILMYTSGTTGTPKGALLPHRKTLFNSLNAQLFFETRAADRVLVPLPLFHSFGLNILALPALYAGAALVLERRFEAERVWEPVGELGITYLGGVPTMFRALHDALAAAPPGRFALATLRFLFTAGAAIPVELIRAFEARGLVLKQGFGQTETSVICCLDARDAIRKAGSVGRPVFHADVRIVRSETPRAPARGMGGLRSRRDGRDRRARPDHDARLLAACRRRPPRRSATAGSAPATSRRRTTKAS